MNASRVLLYGQESADAAFRYESSTPFVNGKLLLSAKDHDKAGKTAVEIRLNGKVLFRGENSASKNDYTPLEFSIPDGLVKKGINHLELQNISPTAPVSNWFMVRTIRISPSNSPWLPVNIKGTFSSCRNGKCDGKLTFDRKSNAIFFEAKTPAAASRLQVYRTFSNLIPGERYRVTFDIQGTGNKAVPYIILQQNRPWGGITKWQQLTDIAETRSCSLEFTAGDQTKGQRLHFTLGDQPPGCRIRISGVRLEIRKK